MVTLYVTTTSANKREWKKWRRDTLIKLCSDAVGAAREAESKCESALVQKTQVFAQGNLTAASRAATRIGTISEQLYLMSANHLADTCVRMKEAAEAINLPANQLRIARINADSRRAIELKNTNAVSPGWFVEGTPADEEYRAKIQEMNRQIHMEMVTEHEERYAQTKVELEKQRATFVRRGRIELK